MPSSAEVVGKTTILQEACTSVDVLGKHYTRLSGVNLQGDIQDLTKYYARPRLLATGNVTVDARTRMFTKAFTFADILTNITAGGMQKLTGVYGLRFKLVFTLQLSSTPFHQGLLAMSWQYGETTYAYDRASNSATATNIPHVKLDIASTTMATLSVPYLAPYDFMVKESTYPYGSVSINVLLPVPTISGMAAPTYKLLFHLEDMDFVGVAPNASRSLTIQSGVEKEFEDEAYPVSSLVSSAGKTVKWLARAVPSLSSLAGPPAWFLAKSAGALRSYGFARPQLVEPPRRVFNTGTVYEHCVDMPSPVVPLCPFASNHLAVTPTFAGTDVDEMALAYITSQYSQLFVSRMKTSDTHDTQLWAAPLSLAHMWFRAPSSSPYFSLPLPGAVTGKNSFIPTHLLNLGTMFAYWRSGFKFRFTFSKTKMHGGRVVVSFIPKPTFGTTEASPITTVDVPESNSVGLQPTGHSAIFDLRDGSVFEFEVPYSSVAPWCKLSEGFGSISLRVMDPLQASSIISSEIGVLVEVCGIDTEYACPIGPQKIAHPQGLVAQSGVAKTFSTDASMHTVGEAVTSVKQLIMLPTVVQTAMAPGTANVDIMPWYYHPKQTASATSVAGPPPTQSYSYGGNLAACYAFARGATDLHVYHAQDSNSTYAGVTLQDASARNAKRATSSIPIVESSDGALHVRCPTYQQLSRFPISAFANIINWDPKFDSAGAATAAQAFSTSASDPTIPSIVPRLLLSYIGNNGTTGFTIKRQAADDAALGHYMGPVPLLIYAGNPTGKLAEAAAVPQLESQSGLPVTPDLQGLRGVQGAKGPVGDVGPTGPPGAAGGNGWQQLTTSNRQWVSMADDLVWIDGTTRAAHVASAELGTTGNGIAFKWGRVFAPDTNVLALNVTTQRPLSDNAGVRQVYLQTTVFDAFDPLIVPTQGAAFSRVIPVMVAQSGLPISTDEIAGSQGPAGPIGPKGDTGPAGPQGPAGALTNAFKVVTKSPTVNYGLSTTLGTALKVWVATTTITGTSLAGGGFPMVNVFVAENQTDMPCVRNVNYAADGSWSAVITSVRITDYATQSVGPVTLQISVFGVNVAINP